MIVKFTALVSLYSWDGLGQASPSDGTRKGDGDKEGGSKWHGQGC